MSHKRPRDCPNKEDFVRVLQGEVGDESRQDFFRHVLRCPCCLPKLQILAKIKAELEAREGMVPESGLEEEETRALRRVALEQLKLVKPTARPLRFRPQPVAAVAAIGVIALAFGYLFLHNALHSRFALRGSVNQELRLLGPGSPLREGPADFSWSDVPGRDDFRFLLVDGELNTIYETVTEATSLRLPNREREKLASGGTYLWAVLALDDNRRELASASRVFEVE